MSRFEFKLHGLKFIGAMETNLLSVSNPQAVLRILLILAHNFLCNIAHNQSKVRV